MEARLESMGYEIGYRLVERTCQRRWMSGDQLEAIKFVCKDLWSEVRETYEGRGFLAGHRRSAEPLLSLYRKGSRGSLVSPYNPRVVLKHASYLK